MRNKRFLLVATLTLLFTIFFGATCVYLIKDQFQGVHSYFDAVYLTMVTYATLGSSITPNTVEARALIIFLILLGVGALASILTIIVVPYIEEKFTRIIYMIRDFESFKNHHIICGINPISLEIAKAYQALGKNIVVISHDNTQVGLLEALNINYMVGNSTIALVLEKAGILNASEIICALENDAENLLLLMMIPDIFSANNKENKLNVVAVIKDPVNADKAEKVGANQVILPAQLTVNALIRALS